MKFLLKLVPNIFINQVSLRKVNEMAQVVYKLHEVL